MLHSELPDSLLFVIADKFCALPGRHEFQLMNKLVEFFPLPDDSTTGISLDNLV